VNRFMPLPLLALAIASFGIGTTEFIPMGLLPEMAADLGVTIPSAGLLVSGYALGVTFGAPLIAMALARFRRKTALLVLVGVFIAGNVLCALAPGYTLLLLARILTALCHGAFFGIGSVVATGLVPRHQRVRAVSLMFSGLTLANILGVPLGTALGQAAGWRMAFWAIVPIGVIAAVALAWLLPRQDDAGARGLLREFAVLRRRQVALAMSMSVLVSASLFSVFTYVTPLLESVSGIAPTQLTRVLLLFGVAITVGNLLGGRLADWRPQLALIGILGALALASLVLLLTNNAAVPGVLGLLLWGCLSFAPGAALQTRVVDHAVEAPNLAATLNQSAFNFGNAVGAWAGGAGLSLGMGYGSLPWLAALFATAAMGLAIVSAGLARRPPLVAVGAD
jgi:MFS transporter, DHA1 family, inner membrane transport protein